MANNQDANEHNYQRPDDDEEPLYEFKAYILEDTFAVHRIPPPDVIEKLSVCIDMSPERVRAWFEHRYAHNTDWDNAPDLNPPANEPQEHGAQVGQEILGGQGGREVHGGQGDPEHQGDHIVLDEPPASPRNHYEVSLDSDSDDDDYIFVDRGATASQHESFMNTAFFAENNAQFMNNLVAEENHMPLMNNPVDATSYANGMNDTSNSASVSTSARTPAAAATAPGPASALVRSSMIVMSIKSFAKAMEKHVNDARSLMLKENLNARITFSESNMKMLFKDHEKLFKRLSSKCTYITDERNASEIRWDDPHIGLHKREIKNYKKLLKLIAQDQIGILKHVAEIQIHIMRYDDLVVKIERYASELLATQGTESMPSELGFLGSLKSKLDVLVLEMKTMCKRSDDVNLQMEVIKPQLECAKEIASIIREKCETFPPSSPSYQ